MCKDDGIEEDLATLPEFEDFSTTEPLVIWIVYFLALLQKKHFLPNAALSLLLHFFSVFFKILGSLSHQLKQFSNHFPHTLYKFHTLLGTRQATDFIRYVVCPGCSMVYKCKNIFTKMLKDVGMEVPESIETRSKFSMHAEGMIACNNHNMRNPIFTDVGIWGYACYDCCMLSSPLHAC